MSSRSLNKVTLIGNLTKDPELRYTPAGTAVCTFGVATNRQWVTDGGEKREETEFHRIVSWNKLAELCSQLLSKGRKVYIEGRLQTHSWTGQDGNQRSTTEIVIDDMIVLDSRKPVDQMAEPIKAAMPQVPVLITPAQPEEPVVIGEPNSKESSTPQSVQKKTKSSSKSPDSDKEPKKSDASKAATTDEGLDLSDIPF